MSRIHRSHLFRNKPWIDQDPPLLSNPPPTRPRTLALDLIEIAHQFGVIRGKTRITKDEWCTVFYRGDDLKKANQDARFRAFDRWKAAIRIAGFDCTASDRETDPEGYLHEPHFCIDMARAIPWAEAVLEESAQQAAERAVAKTRPKVHRLGGLVPMYGSPVVRIVDHAYSKPVGGRIQTSPCVICRLGYEVHEALPQLSSWRARA